MKKHVISSGEKVQEAFDLLKEASADKKVELQEVVSEIMDRARDVKAMASDKVMDAASLVNHSAHKKPWAYVAGAVFVGFVSGIFMRNKK
ncbi:MAG: hypothetical protein V4534_09205 [Myxococcota bacterium]